MDAWQIFAIIFSAIITVSGILGNVITLAIFVKIKTIRNTLGAFIVNLAVSDLILSALTIPINLPLIFDISPFLEHNVGYCQFFQILAYGANSTAAVTIGFITINRAIKICCGKSLYEKCFTKQWICVMIFVIWILGFAIITSLAVGIGGKIHNVQDGNRTFCNITVGEAKIAYTSGFVLLISVLLFCYWHIYRTVKRSGSAVSRVKKNSKVMKMILSITAAFFICYAPQLFYQFFWKQNKDVELDKRYFFLLSVFLSSVINPVIYCFTNRDYLEAYKGVMMQFSTKTRARSETQDIRTGTVS